MKKSVKKQSGTVSKMFDGSGFFDDFYGFIKDVRFILPMLVSGFAAWWIFFGKEMVCIDGLADERYNGGVLIGQNRVTSTIVTKFFMPEAVYDFMDFAGLLTFFCGIIVFCIILKRVYNPQTVIPYVAFSCTYLTFPLLLEYFEFTAMSAGFCTLGVAVSLYLVASGDKPLRALIIPSVIMMFVISWYEAFMLPYITITALILILALKYNNLSQKAVFEQGMKFALPLVFGCVMKIILGYAVMAALNVKANYFAVKGSSWTDGISFADFAGSMLMLWFSKIFCYLSFTVVFIALIIAVIMAIKDSARLKKPMFLLLYGLMILTIFVFSVYYGVGMIYRAEQAFPAFAAAIMFLLFSGIGKKEKVRKNIAVIIAALLIFAQCQATSYWSDVEQKRYLEEKQVAENITQQLIAEDLIDKPVVFIGEYELSDNIKNKVFMKKDSVAGRIYTKGMSMTKFRPQELYKRSDTLVRSYLTWGVTAFDEPGAELESFFNYHNLQITVGTEQQYLEAVQNYSSSPAYPDKGFISDAGDYVVVNLGSEN